MVQILVPISSRGRIFPINHHSEVGVVCVEFISVDLNEENKRFDPIKKRGKRPKKLQGVGYYH